MFYLHHSENDPITCSSLFITSNQVSSCSRFHHSSYEESADHYKAPTPETPSTNKHHTGNELLSAFIINAVQSELRIDGYINRLCSVAFKVSLWLGSVGDLKMCHQLLFFYLFFFVYTHVSSYIITLLHKAGTLFSLCLPEVLGAPSRCAALHRAGIHGGAAFELCVDFPTLVLQCVARQLLPREACAASPDPQRSHALLNPAAPLLTLPHIKEVKGH